MDYGVDHSVLERARLQEIAEDPRIRKAIPVHVLRVLLESHNGLVQDDLSRVEDRLEAFEGCGNVVIQIRKADGLVLGSLGTVLKNCFEEFGVLYGQIWINVERFSASAATNPDSDEISQDTERDPIVSNCNIRKVWHFSTYLGLFLWSRRLLTASDMATWWSMQWEQRYGCCEREKPMSKKRMLAEEEVKTCMLL
jgi:hypothetical protein